jgi:hypothetical protein
MRNGDCLNALPEHAIDEVEQHHLCLHTRSLVLLTAISWYGQNRKRVSVAEPMKSAEKDKILRLLSPERQDVICCVADRLEGISTREGQPLTAFRGLHRPGTEELKDVGTAMFVSGPDHQILQLAAAVTSCDDPSDHSAMAVKTCGLAASQSRRPGEPDGRQRG